MPKSNKFNKIGYKSLSCALCNYTINEMDEKRQKNIMERHMRLKHKIYSKNKNILNFTREIDEKFGTSSETRQFNNKVLELEKFLKLHYKEGEFKISIIKKNDIIAEIIIIDLITNVLSEQLFVKLKIPCILINKNNFNEIKEYIDNEFLKLLT